MESMNWAILLLKRQVLIMNWVIFALEKTSVDHGIHELSDLAVEKTSVDHGIHELTDLAIDKTSVNHGIHELSRVHNHALKDL